MKATAGHMKDALLHLFMLLLFSRLEKTTPIITHVDYPGAFAITFKSFVKKNNLALESKCHFNHFFSGNPQVRPTVKLTGISGSLTKKRLFVCARLQPSLRGRNLSLLYCGEKR